jgi:two-component system, OmpR family, phosphate regulon response regulator PhoB
MNSTSVLVVEDEPGIAELLRFTLSSSGFSVQQAGDVRAARAALQTRLPNLVLLDWMLPDEPGVQWLRTLRADKRTRDLPVVMLTAKGQEQDKIAGLDTGADDYVTKPFSPNELLARIRAVLRRKQPEHGGEVLQVGRVALDTQRHEVQVDGALVSMGLTEFRLLRTLMAHPGRVFARQQLLDTVWGDTVIVEERTVDVHVLRLRKALSPFGLEDAVRTVRGVGYAFADR